MTLEDVHRLRLEGVKSVELAVADAGFDMTQRQTHYAIKRGHIGENGRRVKLNAFRVGRKWLTSVPAVRRYVESINAVDQDLAATDEMAATY